MKSRPLTFIRFFTPVLLLLALASSSRAQHGASDHPSMCGELPHGHGLAPGEKGMVDRFNNPWRPPAHLIRSEKRSSGLFAADCGGFRIEFEDVILDNGKGFDDRTPITHSILGSTTLGELRRRTACEVFSYLGTLIDVKGSPDVILRKSETDGSGFLAAASPFFKGGGGAFVGGTMYDHIVTGVDPTPTAGDYDAMIIFDFGPWMRNGVPHQIYPDWSTDPGNELDLYSIMLHEITHTLGFMSLMMPSGASRIGGAYSMLDRSMYNGAGKLLIDPNTETFVGTAADLISNRLTFRGERCGLESPIYSPPVYQPGSSLSHFDMDRSGIQYVMRPATGGGSDRVLTEQEKQTLCEIGLPMRGDACSGCAPLGREDFASTYSGVEVCIDVLANDFDNDGDPIAIDPGSIRIETGGGTFRIDNGKLCYTPSSSFVGVARLYYRPTDGKRPGAETRVIVNVLEPGPLVARRDYNLWYFGSKAGMSFNNRPPTPMLDGQLSTLEGSASICDPNTGALLFYTDGVTVWDRNHGVMPNGTDLGGHWTSAQSALIVQKPGDSSIYYIFTTGAGMYHANVIPVFRYSIVDMKLNGGSGDVSVKNVDLLTNGNEQVTATRHCNGRDYWIVTHEWGTNRFYSYLLSPTGISNPIVSAVGSIYPRDPTNLGYSGRNSQGMMKISSHGNWLAAMGTNARVMDLCDFNTETGEVSNARSLMNETRYMCYSAAFSPDNSKLYVSTLTDPGSDVALFQYDLSAGSLAAIRASRYELFPPFHFTWQGGQIQLGPDGKIYWSLNAKAALGVINRPNERGAACRFVAEGFHLGGRTTQFGLPNVIESDLFGPTVNPLLRLRIAKRVSDTLPNIGDTITYTVTVCNLSCADATNVQVEDVLPNGIEYIDGMSNYPRHIIPTIRPQGCESIEIRARVTDRVRFNEEIINCAGIVPGDPPHEEVPLGNNCATIRVPATDLSIFKEASPTIAKAGDQVTYTITVANLGPKPASDIVAVDQLPAEVTYISHNVLAPARYLPTTGKLTIPTLAVGQTVVLTIVVRMNDPMPNEVTNCAEIVSLDKSDPNFLNDRWCAPVQHDICGDRLTVSEYDFGDVDRCDDSLGSISLTNECDKTMELVAIRPPVGAQFVVDGMPTLPITLRTGEAITIPVRFDPDAVGEYSDAVLFYLRSITGTPESDTVIAGLRGRGTERGMRASIVDSLKVVRGEMVLVPVTLDEKLDAPGTGHIRFTLTYDSTMMKLDNGDVIASLTRNTLLAGWRIVRVDDGPGRYTVELQMTSPSQITRGPGRLLNLRFMTFLGRAYTTDLHFGIELLDDSCTSIIARPGRVYLDSICGLGYRLIERFAGKYALMQNSPNPFNPTTEIAFSVALDAHTTLTIYNAAGEEVARLVDEHLQPGSYVASWDAGSHPSGLYYYRLRSGEWTQSRRMLLVK